MGVEVVAMTDMKTIWDRIHVWLAANAPELLASLRPGATDEVIRVAEHEMGVTLPDDVRACYRIHDGQGCKNEESEPPGFLYGHHWQSIADILADWRVRKSLVDDGTFGRWRSTSDGSIRTEWWHPAWVPLTMSHTGEWHFLDLAPAPGGDVGQIISWQNDDPGREVEESSFTEWLAGFAEELDLGVWGHYEGYRGLVVLADFS
jgi:cell wall assembly regulator SMI1